MIDHVEKCPFCGNEPIYDFAILPTKDLKVIVGCFYCLALKDNSYKYDEADATILTDAVYVTAEQWNEEILKLKDTDKYKVFLKHKEEYEKEHGRPMPIWYGICADYVVENKYDDRTIEEKRDDGIKKGLSKEEIKIYLDGKKRRVGER